MSFRNRIPNRLAGRHWRTGWPLPNHPLTWRSIANRVWHYHFGRGLCDTPSDFGRMGGVPSHPELLDWLACELRDNGGSLKHLHRLICTSETWQQTSACSAELAARDPDNRLLARMSRQRLDADSYRDAVLMASGRLDLTMGGPGVSHFSSRPGAAADTHSRLQQLRLGQPRCDSSQHLSRCLAGNSRSLARTARFSRPGSAGANTRVFGVTAPGVDAAQ